MPDNDVMVQHHRHFFPSLKRNAPGIYLMIQTCLVLCISTFLSGQALPGLVSGIVVKKGTDEPVSNCNISATAGNGIISDSLGLFVIRLPFGQQRLKFEHLGFEDYFEDIHLTAENSKHRLRIELTPQVIPGKSVTVQDDRPDAAPGMQELAQQDIRRMPTLYSDVLRSIKILPGVTSNNELSSAYNVRGGNFDENLIYLNGYEIYRPFLLRQGVEENQSLVNPDLVDNMQFHGGAFSANLGDKMSSALQVSYRNESQSHFSGTARADLFNIGIALRGQAGKLHWSAGARYVNPDLFVSKLQTSGSYKPFFADVQGMLNYKFSDSSRLELFLLNARNRFDLTPADWIGNFKFSIADVKAIDIEYDGERNYAFSTALAGLRFETYFDPKTRFQISAAGYSTREDEDVDLTGNIYFDPDVRDDRNPREFLKSRLEKADNSLDLRTLEFQSSLRRIFARHTMAAGINIRFTDFENMLNEAFLEGGEGSTQETPFIEVADQQLNFAYYSGYIQDIFAISPKWRLTAGLRAFYYDYNQETKISPRAALQFLPNPRNTLYFNWGHYYQPPFFYELRNKSLGTQAPLKSQRAVHYILGWDHRFNQRSTFQAEMYYKQLNDLIPYFVDQLKITYEDANSNEGYAYGFDLQYKGQIVNTLNSWISYSYLKTREREADGNSDYLRRLLDQTHTMRIFVQDKIPSHPNVQAHLRMLFGSGYLYHPRTVVTDPSSGNSFLAVDFTQRERYQAYWRFDLGMSARIKLGTGRYAVFKAEVLNVFNNINVAAYSWFQALPGQPVRVPNVFTRRFFNAGVEVGF